MDWRQKREAQRVAREEMGYIALWRSASGERVLKSLIPGNEVDIQGEAAQGEA